MMTPTLQLRTLGAIRSGEYVNPHTHRRLTMLPGFRYYWKGQGAPERVRAEVDRILRDHPRTKWIIAPTH